MSWEEMSNSQYKCPCGLGTYTIKFFMDDWNRSEERWEMDCPTCKQNYRLYTYYYYDSGMECKSYLWVPREAYTKVENIGVQLNKAKKEVVGIATSRYMDKWLVYFQDARTKKEIWRRLTDNGKRYPSLSTFYTHTRNRSPETYLRREFHYDNVPVILQKLGIIDNEVNEKLQATRQIEGKFREGKEQLKKEGYK